MASSTRAPPPGNFSTRAATGGRMERTLTAQSNGASADASQLTLFRWMTREASAERAAREHHARFGVLARQHIAGSQTRHAVTGIGNAVARAGNLPAGAAAENEDAVDVLGQRRARIGIFQRMHQPDPGWREAEPEQDRRRGDRASACRAFPFEQQEHRGRHNQPNSYPMPCVVKRVWLLYVRVF